MQITFHHIIQGRSVKVCQHLIFLEIFKFESLLTIMRNFLSLKLLIVLVFFFFFFKFY